MRGLLEEADHHVLDRGQFAHEFGRLESPAHAELGALARRRAVNADPLDQSRPGDGRRRPAITLASVLLPDRSAR